MQLLVVTLLAALAFSIGIIFEKEDNPMENASIANTYSIQAAQNIYDYATAVKNYAIAESATNQIINDTDVMSKMSYRLNKLGDYSAVVVTDSYTNTYEIISWNRFANIKTLPSSVAGQLINMSSQPRGFQGTNWFVPLIVKNNNCNGVLLNGFLSPINQNSTGYTSLFNSICGLAAGLNYNVGQYALVVQVL